jgi:hypothetical protein
VIGFESTEVQSMAERDQLITDCDLCFRVFDGKTLPIGFSVEIPDRQTNLPVTWVVVAHELGGKVVRVERAGALA